jgi:hypothetical protein
MLQPDLQQTQELLWHLIAAPEGVAAGLQSLAPEILPDQVLENLILPNSRLSATGRLDIYANMYFYRIRDAIADDFPAVMGVIGKERFHNLITEYLVAYPSTSWTLADAASRLSHFVRMHSLQIELPFLANLTQFEWALCESFYASDTTPLKREDLVQLAPDAWPQLVFSPVASLRLVSTDFDVRATREIADKTGTENGIKVIPAPAPRKSQIIVWRQNYDVMHRYCHVHEALVLSCFMNGKNFADTCEALAVSGDSPENPITALAKMLAVFVEEEILTFHH